MCRLMPIRKQVLRALRNGSARRSLFGPIDHDELHSNHQDFLLADMEDASRRWGFNFLSDTPIEGSDFLWEAVPATEVPALYRPSMVSLGKVQGLRRAIVEAASANIRTQTLSVPERASVTAQDPGKIPERKVSCAMKRKQTNITDFYQAKRRAVSTPRKSGQ